MHQFTSSPLTTSDGIAVREKSKEQMQKGEKEQRLESTEWDVFRAGVVDIDEQTGQRSDQPQELCAKIDSVASRLKEMINLGDQQLSSGVSMFIARFDKLSAPRMRPKLTSVFHQFGREMGATTITQGGQLRHGKRISVQVTAAWKRAVKSHGKRRQDTRTSWQTLTYKYKSSLIHR